MDPYPVKKFDVGFWHPFGEHAGEKPEAILERKQKEINDKGWTLWSFSYRTPKTLRLWVKQIGRAKKVLVFCSDGKGSFNPKSKKKYCKYYLPYGSNKMLPIPAKIKIPHPMRGNKGSAFIVKRIIYPVQYTPTQLDWFFVRMNTWQPTRSSTRGEHLIKVGKGKPIGKFNAVLELKKPYLAEVSV